ncbi:MAG: hypothetical protein SGARI_000272 [Bacillariaceae sp.]
MNLETARQETIQRLQDLTGDGGTVPGIQYVVVTADKVLLSHASGVQDMGFVGDGNGNGNGSDASSNNAVTESTTFLSSSTTKVLTALGIWKLVDQGKVKLEDPLSDYYPQHPYDDDNGDGSKNIVRVRHLLNQTSGIPNPLPLTWLHTVEEHDSYSAETEEAFLQEQLQKYAKPDFAAGSKYAYSNLSYWLLGKVIEKASGVSYRNYMRTEVFDPLGIPAEELDCEIPCLDEHAHGHQPRFSMLTLFFWLLAPSKLWDFNANGWCRFQTLYMNGAPYGGMNGTAMGYAKVLQHLLGLLTEEDSDDKAPPSTTLFSSPKESISQMFATQQGGPDGTEEMPVTLGGWHIGYKETTGGDSNNAATDKYFYKCGGGPGYSSNVRLYPRQGIATVYLCNTTQVSETPINALSDELDPAILGCITVE